MADAYLTARPAAPLAPFIERYVGYRIVSAPAGVHRGLPSRNTTFIVSIGETIDVLRQTDPDQPPASYRTVISGLQASPALISHEGRQEGVAIELTPPGFRALFGMPIAEVWNMSLELEQLDPSGGELWERLQEAAGWRERFDACDRVLTGLLGDGGSRSELAGAWSLLVGSGGNAPIEDVAWQVGWSRRNLTRRFGREFGLGPKLAGRVIRFERAHELLGRGGDPARVAATCGYFDQAHMNRDFVDLAGLPPARLAVERAEEVPSFQEKAA